MLLFLYNIIIILISPWFLVKLAKPKPANLRWKEYLGYTPEIQAESAPIWIHAASVGEVITVVPLVKKILYQNPNVSIVFTTTTSTGAIQVERLLGNKVHHRFMPFDIPFCVNKFIDSIKPKCFLIAELEIWPNTIKHVSNRNIPIAIINSRLSNKSYKKYSLLSPLFSKALKSVDIILCQYSHDENNFIQLGVEKSKVKISGSLKFDITIDKSIYEHSRRLEKKFQDHRFIWVAASTHKGEDEIILNAHKKLLDIIPSALVILAPRHLDRVNEIHQLCILNSIGTSLHTSQDPYCSSKSQLYLVDTMGDLLSMFAVSDVSFVGGSLIGKKVGGHNTLEPAAFKKPILTGPSYFNFLTITELLAQENALKICSTESEIFEQLKILASSPTQRSQMGDSAYNVLNLNKGSTDKTLKYLTPIMRDNHE